MENIVVYGGGPNDESGKETRALANLVRQRLRDNGISNEVVVDWNYDRPVEVPDSAPENTSDIVNAAIEEFYS